MGRFERQYAQTQRITQQRVTNKNQNQAGLGGGLGGPFDFLAASMADALTAVEGIASYAQTVTNLHGKTKFHVSGKRYKSVPRFNFRQTYSKGIGQDRYHKPSKKMYSLNN